MTPAGTSNELDVQNGWEENKHSSPSYVPENISSAPTNEVDVKVGIIVKKVGSKPVYGGSLQVYEYRMYRTVLLYWYYKLYVDKIANPARGQLNSENAFQEKSERI